MRFLLLFALLVTSVPLAGCGDEVLPIAQARDRRMYSKDIKAGKGADPFDDAGAPTVVVRPGEVASAPPVSAE